MHIVHLSPVLKEDLHSPFGEGIRKGVGMKIDNPVH
jgi:hypothetical protein